MSDPDQPRGPDEGNDLVETVREKETRKLRARRRREESVWFGLGMFGLVGWSVAIPTLICLALGLWIDRTYPSRYSWTLMFLFIGVALGALNAWYWLSRERTMIEKLDEEEDDRA
jgi:ATP synthase protein I